MSSKRFSLQDKVAVVSGGSRGIGEAIAMGLAEQGATVVVSSRDVDACQLVADRIVEKGGKAIAVRCHAGRKDEIETLFDTVDDKFGRVDILINNGATNPFFGPMIKTPEDAFDKTFEVNVKGPFLMSSAAIQRMRKSGGGAVVTVASITAINPGTYMGVYAMTKAALVNMTKGLARENAKRNVRINAILPGFTDTKFTAAIQDDKELLNSVVGGIPAGRMALPEEMVGGVLYLVSDEASYTNGTTLVIDGAMTS